MGWRGGAAGGRVAAGLAAVVVRAGCFLAAAGADLVGFAAAAAAGRDGVLTGGLVEVLVEVLAGVLATALLLAAGCGFALADLARDAGWLLAVEGLFFVDFAVEAVAALSFVALRTGAFSAPERLASGLGRGALFASNLGFLAVAAPEPLPVTGRDEGLFALLLTDSLMRSSIIKMTPVSEPRNARSLTQPVA